MTRRFYDEFSRQKTAFTTFIDGIPLGNDRDYYAALMLNRLMFTWFLQAKGFLDGDRDYLSTRLRKIEHGELPGLTFHQFYRGFLKTLFHGALATPEPERDDMVRAQLGDVPYINGGIFEEHRLELDNAGIDIPNEAFTVLFEFFGRYTWHLDDRPLGSENEINPDVLGYIFEKYVNQKEKGAYYTKEDVTGYISQNTIIPWLLDKASKDCRVAFDPAQPGNAWELLKETPERYIYGSMRHGVIDEHNAELPMPDALVAGEHDIAQRHNWNQRATEPYALPTETWREYFHRRKRTLELRDRLRNGEIHAVDDLITWNLDIRQFAQDVVDLVGGVDLIRAFWRAIRDITILDPTVGSGAFLFAAVKVIEPLYGGLLERMEAAVQREPGGRTRDFAAVLSEAAMHPNREYFVLRQIILRNLYGVDIEEEAVEICKLRLFLLLAAQLEEGKRIEPLPDIDFNIRAGNTLVGYATRDEVTRAASTGQLSLIESGTASIIDEAVELADRAFQHFKEIQTDDHEHRSDLPNAKRDYQQRLDTLRDELDGYLYKQQGAKDGIASWRARTQPFHWFAEFHSIVIGTGGFDVIIGNPPYVRASEIRRQYELKGFKTERCPDIYAMVLERAANLLEPNGRSGMIVPLSLSFAEDFEAARIVLETLGNVWVSSFDNIPAALFSGVSQRCTVVLAGSSSNPELFLTKLHRWRAISRDSLFYMLAYASACQRRPRGSEFPRHDSLASVELLHEIQRQQISHPLRFQNGLRVNQYRIRYAKAARNFVSVFATDPPYITASTMTAVQSNRVSAVSLPTSDSVLSSLAALAGELYMWYWLVRGDGFDVTSWVISDYLPVLNELPDRHYEYVLAMGKLLEANKNSALTFKLNGGYYVGNYNYRSLQQVTRRSDLLIMDGMGVSLGVSLEILDYVQRTLLANESAGERGIPESLRQKFPRERVHGEYERQQSLLQDIDSFICDHTGLTAKELECVLSTGYPQWPSLPD